MTPVNKTIQRSASLFLLLAALFCLLPQSAAAAPRLTDGIAQSTAAPEAGEATVVMLAAPLPSATPLPAPLVWGVVLLAALLFVAVTHLIVARQRRELALLRQL